MRWLTRAAASGRGAQRGAAERTHAQDGRRTLVRYLLFQIPGWLAAGAVALAARDGFGVSGRIALGAWLLWLLKDAVLYRFVRRAYEPPRHVEPAAALVGARGIATEPLAPTGYVRIGPELWRAELPGRSGRIEQGRLVRVRAVRGLTLVVEALPDSGAQDGAAPRPAAGEPTDPGS